MNLNWSRLRKWINKDDGTVFQIENENLRWFQTLGCLVMIAGICVFPLNRQLHSGWLNAAGWIMIVSGGALFSFSRNK